MRIDWAPAALRAAGLTVVEHDGCYGRGRDLTTILSIVNHGTGSDHMTVNATVDLLIEGRHPDDPDHPDHLPGPLAQWMLDFDGVWHFIADGRCNHNGYGAGGNETIGVEAMGKTKFTAKQQASWHLGNAAMCHHLHWPASRARAHKETDPRRKPDPIGVDMHAFRAAVDLDLNHLEHPTAPHQEDDMPYSDWPLGDKMMLANDVANVLIDRLTKAEDANDVGGRIKRATRAAERVAAKLGVSLQD
jgi:hypothetical protein